MDTLIAMNQEDAVSNDNLIVTPTTDFSGNFDFEEDDYYEASRCFDTDHTKPLVVCMRDVKFKYNDKEKLIEGLNLNVKAGGIYGLLGPSGCGKSTTLKLILGLIRPRKGKVLVFGDKPNTASSPVPGAGAGYMPQELALMPTMTIGDHFQYYGSLNGMDSRAIGKKSAYLLELLQIPSMDRPIEKLSGGQKRRASLALSLLHSPPLLILDEPTVGIDPLLRNKIWEYLHQLTVEESKTVILTTHYIEEARNAHTIGLMRYGRLLAETNPDRLLTQFRMHTIEEVFLNLCEKEDMFRDSQEKELPVSKRNNSAKRSIKTKKRIESEMISFAKCPVKRRQNYFNWSRVCAIVLDAFKFMKGKFWTIFVACILPTLQIFLFHFSIGKPVTSFPISVSTPENRTSRFSDVLIESLESRNIEVVRHQTPFDSSNAVVEGNSYASFEFHPNFTKCLLNRVRKGYEASDYDIDCSRVRMSPDNTYQFIIFQLALVLRDAFAEAIYRFFPKLGYNPDTLNVPVVVEEYVYGSEQFSYQEFMTPGMYMALVYLAPLIVTQFVLLEHKVSGHVERSLASGAKPLEILTAHFLANFSILILQVGLMMATSLNYFEAQNLGSIRLLIGIVFMVGVAGVCLAILMATVIKNKFVALVFIYGLTISLWMSCGVFWPIQNITLELGRRLVRFLPLTLPIETARNIMNRGWSWEHPDVLLGFGSTGVYCVIPLLLAFLIFK